MSIRIGIVGCGAISGYLHAPAIQLSPSCELTALVDTNLGRAKRLAKNFGVKHCAESIVDIAGEVDALVLAVPPHVRVNLLAQAMELGLDVLCEKPLANTVAECEQVNVLAERYQRVVGVCHQYRFWPNRNKIRELFTTGELDKPRAVSLEMGRPNSWNSVSGYTVRREWVPGGVLINAGIHPLDTFISWFGDPVRVQYTDDACGGLESNARMDLEFSGNVQVKFRMSRTCNLENRMRLVWDDFSIAFPYNEPYAYEIERPSRSLERVLVGDPAGGFLKPTVDLYDDFCNAIETRSHPMVDAGEGTRVIRLIETCYRQKKERGLPSLAPLPGLTW